MALGYEASDNLELLAEVSGVAGQDFEDDEFVFNIGVRGKLSEVNTLLTSAGRSFRDSASDELEFLLYTSMQFNF